MPWHHTAPYTISTQTYYFPTFSNFHPSSLVPKFPLSWSLLLQKFAFFVLVLSYFRPSFPCTDKEENKIFLILYKEIQMGAVAKSYMRKGFLIYEEMRKYLVIYEEAVSHVWLYHRSLLDFLKLWGKFCFFFISVVLNISPLPDVKANKLSNITTPEDPVYLEHVEQGLGKADGVHGDGDAVRQREHEACAPTSQHIFSRKNPQLFHIQIRPMLWIHWYRSADPYHWLTDPDPSFFPQWATRCQHKKFFSEVFCLLLFEGT
jgi:hypothetical protein